jgi:predicted outer membrane protein
MRNFVLTISTIMIFSLPACKKGKASISDVRETGKMAIIPLSATAGPEMHKEDGSETFEANMASIESGFMVDAILAVYADQHAASPAVRQYAKSLGRESARLRSSFKEICNKNGFVLPLNLTPGNVSALESLKGKRNAEFDKCYRTFIEQMLKERKDALAQVSSAEVVPDLKGFASSYAGTVDKWHKKSVK